MSHVCRTCSRVNPPEALFCYYDGVALASHHQGGPVAAGAKPFPSPFVLPSGRQCRNFDELVRGCDDEWAAAQELLTKGFFESFLGGLGRVDLAFAARQAAKEADHDRALDQFLNKLPVSDREGAKLFVHPTEINLGTVLGERRFVVRLQNQGSGLLTGTIAGDDTKWLAFGDAPGTPQKIFQCRHDSDMAVHVVGKHLRAGNKPVEGRIVIETNGGTAVVTVRAEKQVQPFPDGVLAGAKLPREIAAKAKAKPKEAAALFENGAVQAWYEANGWSYPVQGPSSSGLGAIQQFYEALGLVQPPKVTLNQPRLQFQGRPGAFLEQLIQLHTVEKRPVYAHATTTTPWVQLGRPILEGRSASIPVRVLSVPATPGERLTGTIQVVSNGNQRFTVEVELVVTGSAARPAATAPVLNFADVMATPPPVVSMSAAAAAPLELEGGRDFTASRPPAPPVLEPVEPIAPAAVETLDEVLPTAVAPVLVPAVTLVGRVSNPPVPSGVLEARPTAAVTAAPAPVLPAVTAYDDAPQAFPLLPFIAPVVPVVLLGCSLFIVLLHDLLLSSVRPPEHLQPVDPTPLIALRFHDGPKPDRTGKDVMPEPTMRFGLLMRRSAKAPGLSDQDLETLRGREPADLTHFKRLTFDDWGRSNNTCLKVDGREYLFGGPGGQWVTREEPVGAGPQGVRSVWRLDGSQIEVTQTVEIVVGELSRRYDTCLVSYRIENKDRRPHTVGIRFLLDTYIGENDGVPFTIPNDPALCDTMKEFVGRDQVPDYIQALEKPDLSNPGTVAHLQFRVSSRLESPTRVQLAHWPHHDLVKFDPRCRDAKDGNTLWEVPLVSMSLLHDKGELEGGGKPPKDSAVTMYWDPEPLDAGMAREVGFTYGLGNVSSGEGGGRLALTVGGRLVRDAEFTLTALVANPKPGEQLTLTVPNGLKVVGSATQTVPPGAARDTSTVTWKVRAVGDGEYTLKVQSSNGETQSQGVTIRSQGVFD
jgi:hypothetical protein